MRTHPLYGHPHAITSAEDLAPRTFERLDLAGLDRDQRDRLTAAAERLKSCIWEMNHD